MTKLMIKDLARTEELDGKAMRSVRGGMGSMVKGLPDFGWGPMFDIKTEDFKFDATQLMSQTQNTVVNNGNNVAFSSGITANVAPSQKGSNNITFG